MKSKSSVSVYEAAKFFHVDPATIRRWVCQGCPTVRKGRRGPGHGARLNLDMAAAWRGRASRSPGLTAEEVVQRIAVALLESLERDRADIRVGISREETAAALIVAWERCCKNFNVMFKFDQQPEGIRALMREL